MTKYKFWILGAFMVFKDAVSSRIDLRGRLRKSIVVFVFTADHLSRRVTRRSIPALNILFKQLITLQSPKDRASSLKYLAKAGATPIIEGNDKVHLVWFGKADTLKVEGELQRSWAIPQVMTRIDCGEARSFLRLVYASRRRSH